MLVLAASRPEFTGSPAAGSRLQRRQLRLRGHRLHEVPGFPVAWCAEISLGEVHRTEYFAEEMVGAPVADATLDKDWCLAVAPGVDRDRTGQRSTSRPGRRLRRINRSRKRRTGSTRCAQELTGRIPQYPQLGSCTGTDRRILEVVLVDSSRIPRGIPGEHRRPRVSPGPSDLAPPIDRRFGYPTRSAIYPLPSGCARGSCTPRSTSDADNSTSR